MRAGGGKAKGSAYERVVAKILTAAYYADSDGLFQRILSHPIPGKGETRGDLKALRYRTDILITRYEGQDLSRYLMFDETWPFTVECKNYKDVKPFFQGLWAKDTALFGWMEQAQMVATEDRKMPLVVFRLFRTADVAMIWNTDYVRMAGTFGVMPQATYLIQKDKVMEHTGMRLFLLKDFLDWIDWGVFKALRKSTPDYIRSILPKEDKNGKNHS